MSSVITRVLIRAKQEVKDRRRQCDNERLERYSHEIGNVDSLKSQKTGDRFVPQNLQKEPALLNLDVSFISQYCGICYSSNRNLTQFISYCSVNDNYRISVAQEYKHLLLTHRSIGRLGFADIGWVLLASHLLQFISILCISHSFWKQQVAQEITLLNSASTFKHLLISYLLDIPLIKGACLDKPKINGTVKYLLVSSWGNFKALGERAHNQRGLEKQGRASQVAQW